MKDKSSWMIAGKRRKTSEFVLPTMLDYFLKNEVNGNNLVTNDVPSNLYGIDKCELAIRDKCELAIFK